MNTFWGKVRKGQQRGKLLGFPTANIALHKKIEPGVYLSQIKLNNVLYPSLTFIGKAETFDEKLYQAETYILNFDKTIYNRWITVQLLKKIRGSTKFRSQKELVKQMKEDEKIAKQFFHC